MPKTNREIADLFDRIGDMLQIQGDTIFTVLAYHHAADAIRELPRDLRAYAAEDTLEDIPHVGKAIAAKIRELVETDGLAFYDRLAAEVPPGVVDILHLNGVGPKKAKQLWEAGFTTLDALEAGIREGRLNGLPGMGAKTQANIAAAIVSAKARSAEARVRIDEAMRLAEALLAAVRAMPGVEQAAYAGSLRRARPTIGDIDLLAAAREPAPIMAAFSTLDTVSRVLGSGESKTSVLLHNGMQADLKVIAPERWGTALQYFTGSQAHNIRIRGLAQARGYTLNEHALTPLDGGEPRLFADEDALYAALGLFAPPPEVREDWGEIEQAAQPFPALVGPGDIVADLHMHTTWSDGRFSIREMAEAARALGRTHIVITDHSVGASIANGLSIERLRAQADEVRAVDAAMRPFRVFHGTEMEIRADGSLDFPDEVLAQLDWVIASLHVGLRQPRAQVTERLLNALRNPYVDLIAHPRGQLILSRDGADLDMDAVFATARETGTALEINADPERLDLEAGLARRAHETGIALCIDTDAHHIDHMANMRYGVLTARRAWLTADAVLNTWPLERWLAWKADRRARALARGAAS
jgi:DNA polymerase (family 10)